MFNLRRELFKFILLSFQCPSDISIILRWVWISLEINTINKTTTKCRWEVMKRWSFIVAVASKLNTRNCKYCMMWGWIKERSVSCAFVFLLLLPKNAPLFVIRLEAINVSLGAHNLLASFVCWRFVVLMEVLWYLLIRHQTRYGPCDCYFVR